jgi:hypothetical protein
MENYSLNYKGNESTSAGFIRSKETAIRKYDFLKNNTILCRVEITKREDKIESNDGNTAIILDSKRYINIIENDRSKKEYAINTDKKSYLTYRDNGVGSIKINYYQSRNKNDLEQDRLYTTGFTILINDREYGILAFNPLLFYRKNSNTNISNNTHDKTALCILAAYASYLYD